MTPDAPQEVVSRGLPVEGVEGPAARAGMRIGDRIVAVGGTAPLDLLDLEYAAADGGFSATVERDGERLELAFALERGESHGVRLWNGIGVATRRCGNCCPFCFVDQVPDGMRSSLSVKDDDYRLSFLAGSFITLANMGRDDLERVARLRLSPLYVSLHAWDDGVRAGLMGDAARDSREKLLSLAAAGIEFHLQVVLCPGVNDGDVLRESLARLGRTPNMLDLGVVPVSLAEEGRLRRVRRRDAAAAIAAVEEVQLEARARLGRSFAHGADELHLLCRRTPPACDAPAQYENGIGIVAATIAEAAALTLPDGARLALLAGRAAAPVLERLAGELRAATRGGRGTRAGVRVLAVDNRTFGPHVTVTGLLGGRDVLRRLGEEPLAAGEWLLAPRSFLPEDLGVTIDDVAEATLRDACDGRLAVAETLGGAVAVATAPPSV